MISNSGFLLESHICNMCNKSHSYVVLLPLDSDIVNNQCELCSEQEHKCCTNDVEHDIEHHDIEHKEVEYYHLDSFVVSVKVDFPTIQILEIFVSTISLDSIIEFFPTEFIEAYNLPPPFRDASVPQFLSYISSYIL